MIKRMVNMTVTSLINRLEEILRFLISLVRIDNTCKLKKKESNLESNRGYDHISNLELYKNI